MGFEVFSKITRAGPNVVITDQDLSMKAVIAKGLPLSKHWYCMWHIMEKFLYKVGSCHGKDSDFVKSIKYVIWADYSIVPEFEDGWNNVIKFHGLNGNKWLLEIFEMQSSWNPAYFRDVTMGGLLRTTSRSESENSFSRKHLHAHMRLLKFYKGFQSTLESQGYNRIKNEADTKLCAPKLTTSTRIEEHATEVFSLPVFKEIQAELVAAVVRCALINVMEDSNVRSFSVRDSDYMGE